ncbi:14399_t:CDS:1, partial [Racocetra persica]
KALSILRFDNSKEFTTTVTKYICEALGITIRYRRLKHPMSQEQVEYLN